MARTDEVRTKLASVRALLESAGLDAIVLRTTANAAWLSAGGRTHVLAAQDVGLADLVVTPDAVRIVTTVNEVDRLLEEALGDLDAEVDVLPWHGNRRAVLPTGPRVGWDAVEPDLDAVDVGADVRRLRRRLLAPEVQRARALGADAAAAVTSVAVLLEPEWREYAVAGAVAGELLARAVDPVVLLVAGADRLPVHRHPLPTDAVFGDLGMVVVCGRRDGLIVSLTRMVSFGGLDDASAAAFRRLLEVDVAFNSATRPEATVGAAFTAGTSAYAAHGFAADEWVRHHQGGPAGYQPRDEVATAASRTVIGGDELFAWNPSVPGLKSEDTVLTSDAGVEIITSDGEWPVTTVAGLPRPLVLER